MQERGRDMKNNSKSIGIGICNLLACIFIVLKLCHVIEWGWGWVLAPLWIPFIIAIIAMIVIAFIVK